MRSFKMRSAAVPGIWTPRKCEERTNKGTREVVTASLGVAGSEDHPDADFTRLVAHADNALYSAKRLGKNRIEFASKQSDSANPAYSFNLEE